MNLHRKYIKINDKNVEKVINYVYSKGYSWIDSYYNIDDAINFYNLHKYNFIVLSNNVFGFMNDVSELKLKEHNIQKYLREEKLKRILKTKCLLKSK